MKALRAHHRGGAETLVYEDAPVPVPGAGEVLVKVHAAGITFTELGWDETWRTADGADRTPIIPAHEVSGVVEDVGDDVSRFARGDEVYGRIGFNRNGAAAEYVATPASDLALRPLSVSHLESATLPLAALTAWQALFDHAHLQPHEHVLVLGGAGGVGSFAVQLAKHHRAHVTATAGAGALEFVSGLGADVVVNYETLTEASARIQADVVIDAVGGPATAEAIGMVRPGGRFVTLSQPVDQKLLAGRDITGSFFVVEANPDELAGIAGLVDRGDLRTTVAQVFPLADGRAAFEDGPKSRRPGKTVLQVLPARKGPTTTPGHIAPPREGEQK
ncbi:NADP-dependent oxidoreductase [Glaciibacter flavus]|uniref:NADP-dependent oxidoreductase n=1 Tax=Orlajensenia flava TaxID=2565934 RepID=A0A4S4FPA4_9MICO|nr:NADP-dependent oxidoreductase [Glaciibacter flavus]THG31375.1 NADP-dependent oxidoreductase [Glaciibacter flavus]